MDQELLAKLLAQDSKLVNEALEILYRNNFKKVKRFILTNQGIDEDARDIFQEGIMIFYFNLLSGKFRQQSAISSYIFSICRNLWLQRLKKIKESDDLNENINTHTDVTTEINSLILFDLLNELKEECTNLLIGFYFYGKSMNDLMKEFSLGSEQAAKNKKYRCLDFLIRKIKERNLSIENFYL